MSVENVTTAVASTEVAKVEKEPRIALPVIEEADYKTLEYTTPVDMAATAAILNISDLNEYAQFAAVAKGCSSVKIAGNAKGCVVVIDGSHPKNTERVALLNAELAGKVVVANITYNGAERLRISAKNTGTSKVKPSTRGSFFDRDLAGVVDMGEFNYIFGKEGSETTKELNTKICRVVKALVPFGLLYSDDDKSGFHKTNSRIPSDARTKDNYSWFFDWSAIEAKLSASVISTKLVASLTAAKLATKAKGLEAGVVAELTAEETAEITLEAGKIQAELNIVPANVVADIVSIIENIYPTVKVDTTKTLYIEALMSVFAEIKSEKFSFDAETRTVVSLKEAAKAEKAATKAAEKEAREANKKAKKAEKAAEEATAEAVVAPVVPVNEDVVVAAAPAAPVAVAPIAPVAPVSVAPVAPVAVTPVAPVAVTPVIPGINANSLLDNINPNA